MAYLYIAEFENQEGLVKIGISSKPDRRFKQLSRAHGPVLKNTLVVYTPKNYKQLEKVLHASLKDFKVRVGGDGGTEFFDKACRQEALITVSSLLQFRPESRSMSLTEYTTRVEDIRQEKKSTKKRKLVDKLKVETTNSVVSLDEMVNTVRGQRVNLSKNHPMVDSLVLKVVWEGSDIDTTLFLLDNKNKVVRDDWTGMLGYGNLNSEGMSHAGDLHSGDTEEIIVELSKVPEGVDSFLLTATTYSDSQSTDSNNFISKVKVYLIDEVRSKVLYTFTPEVFEGGITAVEFIKIYRKGGDWRFISIGEPAGKHLMGLEPLVVKYAKQI